jgi:hypothetical protein
MIEIYLASLLVGLGTMYNQAQHKKPLKKQNNNLDQDKNPYNKQIVKKIKKEEKKLRKKLDKKYKTILPRSFSNLLDEETSKLLKENDKFIPDINIIKKYLYSESKITTEISSKINDYFINFYNFCFVLNKENMIKGQINFKL